MYGYKHGTLDIFEKVCRRQGNTESHEKAKN